MKPIRVLVVEDSITIRKHIVETLGNASGLEVIGEAADGEQAIELCRGLRPDVITMDMMLPRQSGLAATEQIMAFCPTPILIVSNSLNRGDLFNTYQALAAGAVDVLEKPAAAISETCWMEKLVAKVRMVSRVKVITHIRAKKLVPRWDRLAARPARRPGMRSSEVRMVAIGASTGGPSAILEILKELPSDFDLPILMVIHIAEPFGKVFSEWLASQVKIPVQLAVNGMALPVPGKATVLMAPPEKHLEIRRGALSLTDDPPRHSCRPSVDVLFESVAREVGSAAIACLLTGMGRDGAAGLAQIRQAGGTTLVQDEETCVVFGMPGEAIRLGAADRVLPLSRIADAIVRTAAGERVEGART